MKMKQFSILMVLALALMLIPGVLATSTFVTPGAAETISGSSYVVNATSDLAGFVNCSITASSALTGDSLSTTWLLNSSATHANATIDTTALEDATDWIFAGTCYNSTGSSEAMTSRTGITVDNTVPTAPTSISPTTTTDKSSISITATVVGENTTGCTMTVASNYHSESFTMDHSGDLCSDTISLPGGGVYTITMTATDGTNSSSATSTLTVDDSNGGIYIPSSRNAEVDTSDAGQTDEKQKGFFTILLILGGAYLLFGNKKKGGNTARRRK